MSGRSPARRDAAMAGGVVAACLLLGSPVGLLWSALAPRLAVTLGPAGPAATGLEGKTFIAADGTFLLLVLAAGVLTGALAWLFGRRAGPWTVLALLVGGLLAAKLAATVGVRPGRAHVQALLHDKTARGTVRLFLRLRSPWAIVGWPVGALATFLVAGLRHPEELGGVGDRTGARTPDAATAGSDRPADSSAMTGATDHPGN